MTDPATPRDEDPGRPGVLGFVRDTWMWMLAPLVIAVLAAVVFLWMVEGDATSPFLYSEF